MNALEKIEQFQGFGVGRICLQCKHKQTQPAHAMGLAITTVAGYLGWECQSCKMPHSEPDFKIKK